MRGGLLVKAVDARRKQGEDVVEPLGGESCGSAPGDVSDVPVGPVECFWLPPTTSHYLAGNSSQLVGAELDASEETTQSQVTLESQHVSRMD